LVRELNLVARTQSQTMSVPVMCSSLSICCGMSGTRNLLQGERESQQSSSVCLLQKFSRTQWLLSPASVAERSDDIPYNFSSFVITVSA